MNIRVYAYMGIYAFLYAHTRMAIRTIGENAWTSLIIHNSRNLRKQQIDKRALTIRE